MDCDISGADALLGRVEFFVTDGWQEPAALAAEATIRDLMRQGLDADGNQFERWSPAEVYSPRQQARRIDAGVSVDVKNLIVSRALEQGLGIRKLSGITSISVASEATDQLNLVALGQMNHPKWRYHHKFLAVGQAMMRSVYAAILEAMRIDRFGNH